MAIPRVQVIHDNSSFAMATPLPNFTSAGMPVGMIVTDTNGQNWQLTSSNAAVDHVTVEACLANPNLRWLNYTGGASTLVVATFAALGAANASAFAEGKQAYVTSAKAMFLLMASTAATRTNLRVAASGLAGFQWVRQISRNAVWEVQATWTVDPTNSTGLASDDNTGVDVTHPLLTLQEHAWRLAFADLTTAPTVSVLGSQQAGDQPIYSCRLALGQTMVFTGTPTTIYTSSVTTYTDANNAAAAADDCELLDNAISGGSWTAAGMLAKGVRIRATTGTQARAYVLKDLGASTARTTRPMTAAAASTTFANGDTYVGETLPTLLFFRWCDNSPWGVRLNSFNVNVAASATSPYLCTPQYQDCYFSTFPTPAGGRWLNCMIDAGSVNLTSNQVGQGGIKLTGGGFKGSGTQSASFSQAISNSEGATVCFQGMAVLVQNGTWNAQNLAFFDTTTAAVTSGTGGRVHLLGFISGKGNTSKLLVANNSSQIVATNPIASGSVYLAASTTDATPIQSGSTTSATAITLDANMNGVFQTV